jgi:2-polyprenyl-6-methoxyphenol hydroxylase-like FAD-dependent oxidoreductase
MRTPVVILGAGFGGLELATRLSEELADEVQVTLIDQPASGRACHGGCNTGSPPRRTAARVYIPATDHHTSE